MRSFTPAWLTASDGAVKEALFTVAAVALFILARRIHAQVRQRLLSWAMSALPPKADISRLIRSPHRRWRVAAAECSRRIDRHAGAPLA
jgi:hypothetical protein